MTAPMVDEIVATFDALEADGTTAAVVITGEPPAFCSGADVSSLGALARAANDDASAARSRRSTKDSCACCGRRCPTVAAVNGPAVGAGMNLALACDVRIAGTSARFDTRFVKIGLHPGGGHTWMLERAVGPQAAAAMVLFGAAVDGPRAVEIGLAWSCHPDEESARRARVEFAAGAAAAPDPAARTGEGDAARRRRGSPTSTPRSPTEVAHQAWSLGQGWFPSPVSPASGEPRRMSALTR